MKKYKNISDVIHNTLFVFFVSVLSLYFFGCTNVQPANQRAVINKVEEIKTEVQDAKIKAKARQAKIDKIVTTIIETSDNEKRVIFYVLLVNILATLGNSYYLYKKGQESQVLKDVSVVTGTKIGYIKSIFVGLIKKYYDKFLSRNKK